MPNQRKPKKIKKINLLQTLVTFKKKPKINRESINQKIITKKQYILDKQTLFNVKTNI